MNQLAIVKFIALKRKEKKITISELMDGEEEKEIIRSYDEEQTLELLRRVQELERQKNTLYGMLLIVMGIAMLAIAQTLGGSAVRDFFAGLFLGMSIAEKLL